MVELLIGAVMMAGFLLVVEYARKKALHLKWWHWVLTALGFAYGVIVLMVVAGFLEEGAGQAALVMGVLMGVIAVIYGVALGRFVFSRASRAS